MGPLVLHFFYHQHVILNFSVALESILLEGKEKSLLDHMGCVQGPGLDGVIALLTLHGLDLSSWESHGKELGK